MDRMHSTPSHQNTTQEDEIVEVSFKAPTETKLAPSDRFKKNVGHRVTNLSSAGTNIMGAKP